MSDDDFTTLYTTAIDPPPPSKPNQGCLWTIVGILFFGLLAILI
jgi:hypothetical protein